MRLRHLFRGCGAAIVLSLSGLAHSAGADEDIISIAQADGLLEFNPAYIVDTSTSFVLQNTYETLIREGNLTGFSGGLAERWRVSDDGRVYDFWIRENARWSDGTLIDAAYAAASFEFLGALPETPNPIDFSNIAISVEQDEQGQDFLRFVLDEPAAQFFSYLAHLFNAILPIHKSDEVDFATQWEQFDESPKVYSGPYSLISVSDDGEQISLRPNPGYHSPENIRNDGIDLTSYVGEDLQAIRAISAGTLDAVVHRSSGQGSYLEEHLQGYVRNIDDPTIDMLRFNLNRPALQDPNIRRAIAQITNLSEEDTFIAENNLHIGGSFVPTQLEASLDYPADPTGYIGDEAAIAQARATMTALGYGPNNQLQLEFSVNRSVLHERMANLMRARMKQIFIDATIVVQPWGEQVAMLERKDFDVARYGWSYEVVHPHYLFRIFTTDSTFNFESYSNSDYDRVVAAMEHAFDKEKLSALVAEAEAILRRDVPAVPLYQRNDSLLVHPDLVLGEYNFAGHLRFEEIFWEHANETEDQA